MQHPPQVGITYEGYLERKEGSRWSKVYAVMFSDGSLRCFKKTAADASPSHVEMAVEAQPVGMLDMHVTNQTGARVEFRAGGAEDRDNWACAIRQALGTHAALQASAGDVRRRGKYAIGEQLGEGVAGHVHRGFDNQARMEVAIKTIDKRKYLRTERAITTTKREIDIMRRLSEQGGHPHVVDLYDVFETPDSIYIVMELVDGGQLFDRVIERGSYSENQAATVMWTLVSTLDYMHALGILHRDLKPENILLARGSDTHIKLIDFGMSNIGAANTKFVSKCGTPVYMAPEMFADNPKYNESVDVWATGVLLYIMLSGALPFYSDDPMEFASVLAEAEENLVFHDEDWTHVSDEAKALIQQILVSDPMRRLKSPQILGHPWVVGNATQSPGGSQAPLDRHRLKFDWGGPVAVSAKPVQAHTAHGADANVGGPSGGLSNEGDVVKPDLVVVDRMVRSGDDTGR